MSRILLALLLLAGTGGAEEFRREFRATPPGDRVGLLESLPARMTGWTEEQRAGIAPFLVSLVEDPEAARLHAAALAPLVETGTARGIGAALGPFYERAATPLRSVARAALVARGGHAATEILEGFLRRDASARARAHLALVLGERGDRAALDTLVGALSDPAPMVRVAAAEALTRITGVCRGYDPEAWNPPPAAPAPPGDGGEDDAAGGAEGAPGEVRTSPPTPKDARRDPPVGELVPEFHGIPLDRETVIVVLDFSGSVRGPGADAVRAELARALCLLPSVRRFTVLAFDERLLALSGEPLPAWPDEKERLRLFLDDLPPGRRTELLMPVRSGLALAAAGDGGAQVLIVSDGAPTVPGPALDDLVERARRLPEEDVRVDAAVFGGRTVGLFRYLVRITGGRSVALPSPR